MKYVPLILTFLTLLWFYNFNIISYAGSEISVGNKEKLIEEEINFLKNKVESLESQTKSLNNEIELLERKKELLAKEKALALDQKKEVEKKLYDLNTFIANTEKEIQTKMSYLNKRILELYKKGEFIVLEMLLFPESEESLIHTLNTFHYLNSKDKDEISSLRILMQEKKSAEIRLNSAKEKLQNKLIELTNLQVEIRNIYKIRKQVFSSILAKKKDYIKILEERNSLLQDLMTAIESKKTTSKIPILPITRFKSLLSLPVKGKIVENFGKIRNKKFGTYLKSNGVTIKINKNTNVNAFYDGTVVYADWYKSYGKLVIIDHKDGYFSFYAHLNSFSVKINQVVLKGDVIAKTGDTGSLKGNILHFELWHKKKPLDPLKWIRKKR